MEKKSSTRRAFIKTSALGAAAMGLSVGVSAKSYNRILGANDRLHFGVAGLNGRGKALVGAINSVENTQITDICDVDKRILDAFPLQYKKKTGDILKTHTDIRRMLDAKEIDVIAIATPDHWHAPMAIMGLKAGKHVYVEKPCCHNPAEGELLVSIAKNNRNLKVQMGNQQRSGFASIQAIKDIREGIIGDVYMGKAWYSNARGSIGVGKKVAIPDWLDWELFQGPAPRQPFRDNIVHYNWHWFTNWGTGEINNNGTHELDICRWALNVDYPISVNSAGGRFHFDDDWQFYDTQVANFTFEGGKMITWEGKSCNPMKYYDRGRGVTIHGTKGTILLDRNKYIVYDMDNKVVKEMDEKTKSATTNTVGRGGLDDLHMNNFADGIRKSTPLNSPIEDGYISNLLPHLGNLAQKFGQLTTSPKNGRIIGNSKAMRLWGRDYAPGWDPNKV